MLNVATAGEWSGVLAELARAAFDVLGLSGDAETEVEFVTDEEIRELNSATRGVDRATDVLSYPALDRIAPFTEENYPYDFAPGRGVLLGSIVISLPTAEAQAKEYGHSLRREVSYLFVHGLMHLLGYDHIEDGDRAEMRAAEEAVLGKCGITRE